MPRPPLRQVAELAGVSEPTVSRVLNGRDGVAAATRDRVLAALRELGFDEVPERRTARRAVVGMVCGEFLNPVFATFTHHISTKLGQTGYLTTVAVTDRNLNPEERCIDDLVRSGVDGIVLLGGRHAEVDGDLTLYHQLAEQDIPMVFVNGSIADIDAPHVWCDEEAGARKAVAHLVGLGHERVGCVLGSSRFLPTARFVDGYRAELRRHGLAEADDAIVQSPFTIEGGRAGAARLLERGVTALITGNDLMALGALKASSRDELSVVGYDGTELSALADPPLTTLRQPFEDMAQMITDAITAEIDGSTRFRDSFMFEPQLIVRDSTRPLPA